MTNHDELCEKKWVEQLKQFMAHYGFNSEYFEWSFYDFTALKDYIQLELLHENASLKLKLEDAEREYTQMTCRAEKERLDKEALQRKLEDAEKEIERLDARDGNATIQLCYNNGVNPFAKKELKVVDFGVSDNRYIVEAKLSGSCEGMTWKPIEEAPKDGTMILVCLPNQMNLIIRARYDRIHGYWVTDYEGEGGVCRVCFFHSGDLWMLMPKAPDVHAQMTGGGK